MAFFQGLCLGLWGGGSGSPLAALIQHFPLASFSWAGLVWGFVPNIGPCVFGLLPYVYSKFWVGFLLLLD